MLIKIGHALFLRTTRYSWDPSRVRQTKVENTAGRESSGLACSQGPGFDISTDHNGPFNAVLNSMPLLG